MVSTALHFDSLMIAAGAAQSMSGGGGLDSIGLWIVGVIVILSVGSLLVRFVRWRAIRSDFDAAAQARERVWSAVSWCIATGVLAASVWFAPFGVLLLLALISIIGLIEWTRALRAVDAMPRWLAGVLIAFGLVHYGLIGLSWSTFESHAPTPLAIASMIVLPLAGVIGLAVLMMVLHGPKRFLLIVGGGTLGLLLIVYLPAHAAWLAAPAPLAGAAFGGASWVLLLFLLTEINDIAQALWGRRFGRRHITPIISPKKTWEGLFAGLLTTVTIALILVPLLLPETMDRSNAFGVEGRIGQLAFALATGIVINLAGFAGDLVFSSVKRDIGIKDFGTIMRGQGGMLDRMDSLTLTAPMFFFLSLLYYG